MKLHNEENYIEYDVESPKAISAYMRYLLFEKWTDAKKKKNFDKEECFKEMYVNLPSAKKHLLNNLIQDFLPQSKRGKVFKVYLDRFIKTDKILHDLGVEKPTDLEKYIYSYMTLSTKYIHKVLGRDSVHSAIQRLQKANGPSADNIYVQVLADFFNVSKEVLLTGYGERYYLDLEYIKGILDGKNEDYSSFLNKVYNFGKVAGHFTKAQHKNYEFFVNHSYRVFAELASELLCVNINNILISESCWVVIIDYPFMEFYEELKYDNQKIVQHVLFNLNLK